MILKIEVQQVNSNQQLRTLFHQNSNDNIPSKNTTHYNILYSKD